MKKYLQITIVLGLFFGLVVIRNLKGGSDDTQTVGNPTPQSQTTPIQTTPTAGAASLSYKDGSYTGSIEDAYYGSYQVQAIITGGKVSDIQFLQYPNDNRTSISINQQAMPLLKSEAIQAQSGQVDIISGATDSSQAFIQSLSNALKQARS